MKDAMNAGIYAVLLGWLWVVAVHGQGTQLPQRMLKRPSKYLLPTTATQYDYRPGGETFDQRWIAYSDREANPTYDRPDSLQGQRRRGLPFLERLFVVEELGEYVRLVQDSNPDGFRISSGAVDFGWVHKSKLLFWERALGTEDYRVPRKAIVLNTVEAIGSVDDPDLVEFRNVPSPTAKGNSRRAKMVEIFHVFKEDTTSGMVLLGTSDNNGGFIGEELLARVPGWAPRSRLVLWDHRVAVEPNWEPAAVTERRQAGKPAQFFMGYADASRYKRNERVPSEVVLWDYDPDQREIGSFPRFPIMETWEMDPDIFLAAVMGQIVGEGLGSDHPPDPDPIRLRARMRELLSGAAERLRRINVIFVVDGTKSMGPYFDPVASAITTSMQQLRDIKGISFQFGAVVYRDYSEESMGKLIERIGLRSAANAGEVAAFLNGIEEYSTPRDDFPEAMYWGLGTALGELNPPENETNLVILVGDAGNHASDVCDEKHIDSRIRREVVVEALVADRCHYVAFQVHNDPTDLTEKGRSYRAFIDQNKQIISDVANRRFNEYREFAQEHLISTPTLQGQGSIVEIRSGPSIFKLYGLESGELQEEILSRQIVEHIQKMAEWVRQLQEELNREGTGLSDRLSDGTVRISTERTFSPAFIDLLVQLDFSREEIEKWRRQRYQLSYEATNTMRVEGLHYPLFRRVVMISDDDLRIIVQQLQQLSQSYDARQRIYEFWMALLRAFLGNLPEHELKVTSLTHAQLVVFGIPLSPTSPLREIKVRDLLDPSKVSDDTIQNYISRFQSKTAGLARRLQSREYSFNPILSEDRRFYWIEEELLP